MAYDKLPFPMKSIGKSYSTL